ncbi:MAG TPA: 23S rRNA (guanosine(2251)-2'-O)-methyltransferase RlmB [Stellaceae bacterium]|nr:23S rRNA (guanosine(2251)-2'-O)-methyltransferase RlmB [Stellaceae bacterium]
MARDRGAHARDRGLPRRAEAPSAPPGGRTRRPAAVQTSWIFGRHAVMAVLANPARRCRRVVVVPELAAEWRALVAAAAADLPVAAPEVIERRALEQLLPEGAVHQGIAVAADPLPPRALADIIAALPDAAAPHIVVVLDQVSDPHNVGAVLRSAAAFAARAVVVPDHGAPAATGVVAKAASGALETVPLVRVGNLARTLERLKAAGFWCVGLAADAPQSLATLDLPERVALVLGAEGTGLRRLTREGCDYLAHLPTRAATASLNVSNAAAVALYELTRRQWPGGGFGRPL